jgi:hypothetical protein
MKTSLKRAGAVIALGAVIAAGAVSASAVAAPTASSGYSAMTTTRILDTRTGLGITKGAIKAGGGGLGMVIPAADVAADATAVTLNVTATNITGGGYVAVLPYGVPLSTVGSNLNVGRGQTVANQATVPLAKDGAGNFRVNLNVVGTGQLDLIVDLEGYYTPVQAYTPPTPVVKDLGGVASVATGGGFVANATEVGTVDLAAGTYQVTVNAKATPLMTSAVQVFPQFFVYDQAANADFTGDLLNVGSGALESGGNVNIDSYYSGTGVITLADATTLHVYAFGYDSDRGAGSYQLDDLAVTALPIG